MNRSGTMWRATLVVLLVTTGNVLRAADWPAYRHDLQRSGVTQEALSMPLHPHWIYQSAHQPRPAWPEPGRELNRLAFDQAQEVTAAGGLVFFGSSTDHKVYAIDLATGKPKWNFFTEGPIRFAPTIDQDQVFVASDDGVLYCLNATDGKLRWKFRGGPRDERMIGNGQLISRWPLRSGVAVDSGVVYFAAGMWPNEGVFLFALDAASGKVIWKNDTTGTGYVDQPHPPSCAVTGVAPQGYLLGQSERLFLPTGRSVPAVYDRNSGQLQYYRSRPSSWGDRWGGSWNTIAGDLLLSWRCHIGPDMAPLEGEYAPDPADGIVAFDAKSGAVKRDFPGKLQAVVQDNTIFMSGSGKITAYDFEKWSKGEAPGKCMKWETPHPRAYALILAGDTLVVGGDGTVTAIDAVTGKELWSDKTEGQARSLAVADSRLLVSTTTGQIKCYGQQTASAAAVTSFQRETADFTNGKESSASADLVRQILKQTGKKAGYCLVLGLGTGQLLYDLATQSELTVYCLDNDAAKIRRARQALDRTGLYGRRIVIQQGPLNGNCYPDYFADLVLLPITSSDALQRQSADDVFRVLHPYGGIVHAVTGDDRDHVEAVEQWFGGADMPETEVRMTTGAVQAVRGKLPGAGNWTHQYASSQKSGCSTDQLARLPLKLLWFGEPGPSELVSRHWKGPAPLCVDGRMYVVGQDCLLGVDAYNGRQLWRRDLPNLGRTPVSETGSNVAADDQCVYAVIGNRCLRLDGKTGKTVQTYQIPTTLASPPANNTATNNTKGLTWGYLAVSPAGILGSMGDSRWGQAVFLLDKSGETAWVYQAAGVVGSNAIALDGDRVYVIDQTRPDRITAARKRGQKLNVVWKLVALDVATGKVVWETDKGIAGRTHLWLGDGLLLATGGRTMCGYDPSTGKQRYARDVAMKRSPVIVGDTIYGEPVAFDLATGAPKQRRNPFTGTATDWNFSRSYGCGAISASPNLLLFRSGTLGIDDIAGDTGVHNFGGIRAGCYVNAIAAAGLVLMPTSDAGCTCSYCYQTTIALAPARRRENWSIFFDRLPKTAVRQAALNLGAPGDQRDPEGAIWLATPRPATTSGRRDIAVPFRFTSTSGMETFRANADLVQIENTDRPWVYTSGVKGPVRAELDLQILDRGITAWPADSPVTTDGRQREGCWDGYQSVTAGPNGESVELRYDQDNLYLGFKRPAGDRRHGAPTSWKATTRGDNATVWDDDSFEVYLSNIPNGRDVPSARYLHLGVSASGARYDALWSYVTPALPDCDIPRLKIDLDGDMTDWGDQGLRVDSLPGPGGMMRKASDLDPSFRIGWNDKGLLVSARIRDNQVLPATGNSPLEHGDSLEICVTPKRGSAESYRLVIAPDAALGSDKFRLHFSDYRKTFKRGKLEAEVHSRRTKEGYHIELCLPWSNLQLPPKLDMDFGMQLFVNDSDKKGEKPQFQARWHPAGDPQHDPLAYQTFHLATAPSAAIVFKRNRKPESTGLYRVVPLPHFLVSLPPLGGEGEDTAFSGPWTSGVQANDRELTAELAIPWTVLSKAGLSKDQMMVYFNFRGPLAKPPVLGAGFERLLIVPAQDTQPRRFTVRLHFAELDSVQPGQRTFSVKLQDKVVLKNFDILAVAGQKNRAVVKQFDNVTATRAIRIELVPDSQELTDQTTPTLCGIEILSASDQ